MSPEAVRGLQRRLTARVQDDDGPYGHDQRSHDSEVHEAGSRQFEGRLHGLMRPALRSALIAVASVA